MEKTDDSLSVRRKELLVMLVAKVTHKRERSGPHHSQVRIECLKHRMVTAKKEKVMDGITSVDGGVICRWMAWVVAGR